MLAKLHTTIFVEYHVPQRIYALNRIFVPVPRMFELREVLLHELRGIFVGPEVRVPAFVLIKTCLPRLNPLLMRFIMAKRDMMKNRGNKIGICGKRGVHAQRVIGKCEVEVIVLLRNEKIRGMAIPNERQIYDRPGTLDTSPEVP